MTPHSDALEAEIGTGDTASPGSPLTAIDVSLESNGPVRSAKSTFLRRAKAWNGSMPEFFNLLDDLYELGGDESAESRAIAGPVLSELLLHEELPVL